MGSNQERSFGISVGAVCGLLALITAWRHHAVVSWVLGGSAFSLLTLGWLAPSWLRIPSWLWWRLAHALGWVNTRVLLVVFFFLVVTPVGLVRRLCGWDPLSRRRVGRGNGWVPAPARLRNPKHYERMY